MCDFAKLLRTYRQQCRDPQNGRRLTQARLAELLGEGVGVERYSGSTVSNWERGLNQIRLKDRHVLVALIAILHQTGGIQTQEQANELLTAGNYSPLNKEELLAVDSDWHYPHTKWVADAPSPAEQEDMLPVSHYSRLFGVDPFIQSLLDQLISPHHAQLIALVGVGGIGKTAVADAVARQTIRQRLFAHVLWVELEAERMNAPTETRFQFVIDALRRQLLPDARHERNPKRLLTRLRFKLQQYPHLIVIDNLEMLNQDLILLRELQGILGAGKCLLTSRQQPPTDIEIVVRSVPELSIKDATDLLTYQADTAGITAFSEVKDTDIEALYALVGGHPSALRLVPPLVRRYALSEIVAGWQNEQGDDITQVYQSVYDEVWQTLFPEEKQFMQLMPLLSQTGGTLPYLQALYGASREVLWPVLNKLIDYCLIEPHGNLSEKHYSIHRLTERYILNRYPTRADDPLFSTQLIENGLSFWQHYLEELTDKEWHLVEREQENIFKMLQLSLALPQESVTSAVKTGWQYLFDRLFRYIEQRGYAMIWRPLLEKIPEKFSENTPTHLPFLNRLGELCRLTHQPQEAIEIHLHVLELAKQSEEAEEIAQTHLNLGNDYLLSEQYEEAVAHGLNALRQLELLKLSGRKRASTLNLLGTAVRRQNHLEEASHYLREAAAIWRDLNSRSELARTLRNLASVMEAENDADGAQQCYREAKQVLTKTASELDRTLIYLAEGTFYFKKKQYKKAETAFKHIDLEYLKTSGHQSYQAYTLNNLGNIAYIRERYDEANQLLQESIHLWQQLAKPSRMSNSLGKLGDVLVKQGRKDEARLIYKRALDLLEQYDNDGLMDKLKQELVRELAQLKEIKKEVNQNAS